MHTIRLDLYRLSNQIQEIFLNRFSQAFEISSTNSNDMYEPNSPKEYALNL